MAPEFTTGARQPTAGNHENEALGPHGFQAYRTYFTVPANGATPDLEGLWYSFRAGSVKVIAINNDDVCLQDAGDVYVHGYSQGAQKAWLQRELASARRDRSIDWIVVCMHQVAMAPPFNGADLGIRQEWMPLFDQHGVDLVVAGHEHHYERELPVRGTTGTSLLTPKPLPTSGSTIDTTQGTQHMIIGGGGTSAPSNTILTDPSVCHVITSVGPAIRLPGRARPPVISPPTTSRRTRSGLRCATRTGPTASRRSRSTPATGVGAGRRSTSPTTGSGGAGATSRSLTRSR